MKNDEYINNPEFPLSSDKIEENEELTEEVEENEVLPEAEESEAIADTPTEEASSPSLIVPDDIFGYKEAEAEIFGLDKEDDAIQAVPDDSDESTEEEVPDEETEAPTAEEDATEAEDIISEVPLHDENKKTAAQSEEKPRKVDSLFDFIELFVFTLAAVFIITSFFFRYSTVEGSSMMNTLEDGEKLILSSFLYDPKPGDVVVVQDRSTELKDPIVKRVIAIGGQTLRITPTAIYVDGVALEEDYVYTDDYYNPLDPGGDYRYDTVPASIFAEDHSYNLQIGSDYYEITVPEGEIFVMGDHRNNSKDSRSIGTLHEDAIIGKVVLRFLPFNKFGTID